MNCVAPSRCLIPLVLGLNLFLCTGSREASAQSPVLSPGTDQTEPEPAVKPFPASIPPAEGIPKQDSIPKPPAAVSSPKLSETQNRLSGTENGTPKPDGKTENSVRNKENNAEVGGGKQGGFEVTVSAKKKPPPPSRGGADYHVEVGALADVPRKNASELLKLVPGILLTNDGSEAHADQVFLRGFDAREGQDIEFTVGGMPINESGNLHGNGYADTHFILPELISTLRVLEGPFDPRQGNYAVAGSADYELGLKQRGITAKFMAGAYGTYRGVLLWGPRGAKDGTFAGVELYRTAGFGQNRDGQRATVMAQYEGRSGVHLYRFTAQAYVASFHSAGVIRQDDLQANRMGFFDTYDTGQGADTSRYSLSAMFESRFGNILIRNSVYAIARPMTLRENFTGFLLDPQEPTQFPHGQRGDQIEVSSLSATVGASGFARYSIELFHNLQELEVGYTARGDFVHSTQHRIEAATRAPYHTETDLDSRLGNIGLYADLNLRPWRWFALRGGVRSELFTYDVLDLCAVKSVSHPSKINPPLDNSCLNQQDFGKYRESFQRSTTTGAAFLPRVAAIFGPVHGLAFSASYGQGVRSIDPIYISQDAKTPFASAQSVDVGLSFAKELGPVLVSARTGFFQTKVDRDLLFSQTAGRNILSNGTTRLGSASAARVTGSFFDAAANLTYVHATFDETGLLIPYVPDWVFRFDGSVFGELPFRKLRILGRAFRGTLASGVTYVSPRPLPFGERSNPIAVVDLHGTLGIWLFDFGVMATNLFDSQYRLGEYNYASDFRNQSFPTLVPMRHFSAGAPRQIFFTFAINVGGDK